VRVQKTFTISHVLEHTMKEKERGSNDFALLTIKEKNWRLGKIELSKAMQRDQTWKKADESQTDLSAYETKSSVRAEVGRGRM
jgi:hypothetical protein